MLSIVKKIRKALARFIFPSLLLNLPGKGLRKKLVAMFRRELRAHSSPVRLALSLSLGVFMAILPIHGFQVLILLLLTFMLRLNRPAAMIGVSVSSAPLLPFWIAAGVVVGNRVVPHAFAVDAAQVISVHLPDAVLHWIQKLPVTGMLEGVVVWFIGSIALAAVCGAGAFCISYPLIKKTQCPAAEQTDLPQKP